MSAINVGQPTRRVSALDAVVEQHANQLFERNSIDKIHQWESNTRKEIDDKKQELRRLVGTRYRDLIDSADSITEMRNASEAAYGALGRVEGIASGTGRRGRGSAEGGARSRARDALHVARRLRSLAHAPELVCAALDARSLLPAAARTAHAAALLRQQPPGLAASAPLLARHAAALAPLPARVRALARAALAQPADAAAAADAAGALALLDQWDAPRTLLELLNARKAALRALLVPAAASAPRTPLLVRLQAAVRLVQATLAHVHALWSDGLLAAALQSAARDFEAPPELLQARTNAGAPLAQESLTRGAAQLLDDAAGYLKSAVPRLLPDAELGSSPAQLAAAVSALVETCGAAGEWRARSSALLGSEVDLWAGLGLHSLLLARASELVSGSLAALPQALRQLLQQPPPSAPAAASLWRDEALLDGRVEALRLRASGVSTRGAALATELDSRLSAILSALAPLFAAPRLGTDAALRQHAQAAIRGAAASLVPELDSALAAVRQRAPLDVPCALLLAHVSRSLAGHARALAQALAQWPASAPAPAATRPISARPSGLPEAWKSLQAELRRVHLSGHCLWAAWAAEEAVRGLSASLAGGGPAGVRVARAWQPVPVPDTDEPVPLPAQLSRPLAHALFLACQELARVGAHALPRATLQLHVQLLHRHMLAALTSAAASPRPAGADGRDVAVQLLFDLEVLLELLAGARTAIAEAERVVLLASVAVAADAPRDPARVTADEEAARASLLSLLDPIDAAFYAPHVKRLASALAQRTAALFGPVTAAAARGRDAKSSRSAVPATAPQVMALAPPAARFSLLPMPATLATPQVVARAAPPAQPPATKTAPVPATATTAPAQQTRKSWWG